MQALTVTNLLTGKRRYYLDSIRVTRDKYDAAFMWASVSCLITRSTKTHTRDFCVIN